MKSENVTTIHPPSVKSQGKAVWIGIRTSSLCTMAVLTATWSFVKGQSKPASPLKEGEMLNVKILICSVIA
jgi:hypothetical protein